MSHGVAALTLGGVLAYALGRACYVVFYGQFRISPDEVGINQAKSIETAGLLLAAFAVAVFAMEIALACYDRGGFWWWLLGLAFQLSYVFVAAKAASLGDDAWISAAAFSLLYLGFTYLPRADEVARGRRQQFIVKLTVPAPYALGACLTLIIGGSLTVAWQYGAKAASTGAFSALPFSAIRIDPVCSPE